MFHATQNTHSIWQDVELPVFLPLTQDESTDVCIVGGGIAGLTTAYLLLKKGVQVTIVERDNFSDGETAHTSAHLTNVMDEGFSELLRMHGEEGARRAFESHGDAIDLIEKIANEENIECDFRRIDAYLVLDTEGKPQDLEEEYEASLKAGFRHITLESSPNELSHLGPAIHYTRQARFHPGKYMAGLLKAVAAMGARIHGLSKVVELGGGKEAYVKTDFGHTVRCEHVVIATNVPINDRIQIHTKEGAYRSYVIGIEVPENQFPDILLWDTADPYHYVRKVSSDKKGFETLIIGGEDHRTGQEEEGHDPFTQLETWSRDRLGIVGEVNYRWSGQIIEPFDGLAFIGRNPHDDDNVYIISGDSGQGLTHGTLGATIIRDLILGQPNEWASLYDPSRMTWKALNHMAAENARSILPYEDHLYLRDDLTEGPLLPGEGLLVRDKMREVAVYRDEQGELHTMSALCPHLGGVVHWNAIEKTWDCPCHGSRFACTGEVITGPAFTNLEPCSLDHQKIPTAPAPVERKSP